MAALTETLPARPDAPAPRRKVDKRHHTLAVTIGPFHVPQSPMMMGDMEIMRRNHEVMVGGFVWPVNTRFHGVKLEVIDSARHALPRRLLHHTYMVNADRRQLVDGIAECPFSFGEETDPQGADYRAGIAGVAGADSVTATLHASQYAAGRRDLTR